MKHQWRVCLLLAFISTPCPQRTHTDHGLRGRSCHVPEYQLRLQIQDLVDPGAGVALAASSFRVASLAQLTFLLHIELKATLPAKRSTTMHECHIPNASASHRSSGPVILKLSAVLDYLPNLVATIALPQSCRADVPEPLVTRYVFRFLVGFDGPSDMDQ